MKKVKMLLSLVVMLGLTASLSAEVPQQDENEDFVLPQLQRSSVYNDDIMVVYDIEMPQQDFGFYERNFPEPEVDFNKRFLESKLDKLKVTDKQKEDFKKLQEENSKEIKDLTTKFKTKIKSLNSEFFKEKFSSKEIKNLTKEIKSISTKIIDSTVEKKEELRKILTSKQYNKLFKPKTKYDMLADRLGLSDEQKDQFIKIIETKKEKEKPLRKQLREDELTIKQEFEKDEIDMAVITRLSDEISNISKELLKIDLDSKVELKKLLSPEQYKKWTRPTRPNPTKPIIYEPTDSEKNIDKK